MSVLSWSGAESEDIIARRGGVSNKAGRQQGRRYHADEPAVFADGEQRRSASLHSSKHQLNVHVACHDRRTTVGIRADRLSILRTGDIESLPLEVMPVYASYIHPAVHQQQAVALVQAQHRAIRRHPRVYRTGYYSLQGNLVYSHASLL